MTKPILLAGGGSLGPVTPLLAVAEAIRQHAPEQSFVWAGTPDGPERAVVTDAGIPFEQIPVAKIPRYFSWRLLSVPWDMVRAHRAAVALLDKIRPALVLSAGGFTAVPLIREAANRRIPCIAHQLDYTVGMSNRAVAMHCRYLTTSFAYGQSPFAREIPTYRIATPIRFDVASIPSRASACVAFGLDPSRPVLFVTGGGTGATSLNEAINTIRGSFPVRCQVIHAAGRGKTEGLPKNHEGYVVRELLNAREMRDAYAAADLVIARAGIGTISELAALKKAAILVPLPGSVQSANAHALGSAVRVVQQSNDDWTSTLLRITLELLDRPDERERMGKRLHEIFPTDHGAALAALVMSVLR
ncbi:MAG: undecaprenyldiphospho-muramoylpentapeptide beta-N-acetylglucosaminyltransferase [Candidatus Parcubacteria bacterium]|jgi:UDP-N-acetylglucosamine--N-acetylmuramyl-(pentapeptide) pyrophosphoryl-undecaprenol N-acetylglucosamine transferase